MKPLTNGRLPDPVKDLLIAEFGREAPQVTDQPCWREGLYENERSIYYLVCWKMPKEHYTQRMQRGGGPPQTEDLKTKEINIEQAREWLNDKCRWAFDYLGIEGGER